MPLPLTIEEVLLKFKDVHGDFYDYSAFKYTNSTTKSIIICPVHGEFEQCPKTHYRGGGCSKCYKDSKKFDTEDFIRISEEKHGEIYDYSKSVYTGAKNKILIICPEHGEFEQTAKSHMGGHRCSKCYFDTKKTKNFLERCVETHGNKFDYSKVIYINDKTKIKIICPKHGEWNTYPSTHLNSKTGCRKCSTELKRLTTLEFIENAKKVHGNKYDYSNSKYTLSNSKIEIICKKHGKFFQIPGNHISNKSDCPKCNNSKFQEDIRDSLNVSSYNNKKDIIPPHELDIFIPEKSIAIECNGNYWHSESMGKDKKYHLNKTILCENKNIQLIHIFESEWLFKNEIVKSLLNSKIGKTKKIYARNCKLLEIDIKIKNSFLDKTHLQGRDSSIVKLGLYHNDLLVSVMTFCKSRFNKNYQWELSRYSSELNVTVVGGAGKLLSFFVKNYNPNSIITYSNKRYSNGNLYNKLGFKFVRNSEPNFYLFHKSKKYDLLSRHQFQKHKLPDKLETFDPNISAWENLVINGYDRIWDCGNGVWELIP